MQRRTVLASIGSATTGLLAGCLADGAPPTESDGGDENADGTDDGNRDDTPTGADGGSPTTAPADEPGGSDGADPESGPSEDDVDPSVLDHAVETSGGDCMSDDESDHVDVSFGSDSVSLDGVAAAPDPCREATIESATVEAGELRVQIGLDATGDVCADCVGAIAYSASVEIDGMDGLDTVAVDHGDAGDSHTVRRGGDDAESTPDRSGDAPPTHGGAAGEPDPDLPVFASNRHDAAHDLTVTIARESGETVYDETQELAPGADREIYNLEDADPDGVETFAVRTATGDQTGSVQVETSGCYGRVEIRITEDGTLDPTYSIC